MTTRPEIDHESPVPLYHQIAEALRAAIESGELAPGNALEPMRQAAETWGVHLHTVRHAYAALAREGLVELKRGPGGTRVVGATRQRKPGEAVEAYLDRVAAQALDRYGLTTAELAERLAERAARQESPLPHVYVVECSDWQCQCHAREIAARFRVDARIWPLHRGSEPPDGPVVSTYFHYNDIRRMWPRRLQAVRFLTISPDPELAQRLAGARRLLVCERDTSTAEAVAADPVTLFDEAAVDVEPRVVNDLTDLPLGDPTDPPVLFAPRVWAELPPELREDPRTAELRYVLDREELAALGRSLGWPKNDSAAA